MLKVPRVSVMPPEAGVKRSDTIVALPLTVVFKALIDVSV